MLMPDKFAVIGHPVSHSLTPRLYQYFMNESDVDGQCFRATGLQLEKIFKMLHELNIRHYNVTHPYKRAIQDHLLALSPEARQIGAVNTVMENPGRGLSGHNTDYLGVIHSLQARFPALNGTRVLIAGAGGAARAAAFSLCQAGADITITNRSQDKGKQMASDFSCNFHPLNEVSSLLPSFRIFIWTIPGYPSSIHFQLEPHQVVLDANYKAEPPEDYFGNGERLDGLNWLIYQGWHSFCTFLGRNAGVDGFSLKRARSFLRPYREDSIPRRIVLVGFMGAGKTVIGRKLSRRMGWDFLDTDEICERVAGKSVQTIFREDGEESFRRLEKNMVTQALQNENTIISIGGGALMTPGTQCMINKNAFTIWLYQPPEIIAERCSVSNQRPLFDPTSFKNLMVDRNPSYLRASDLIVESSGGSIEDIVHFLVREFQFQD